MTSVTPTPPVPFVGLRPFDQADQRWFRGRRRETAALTRKISVSRFTAVVGASGSGKSSIVRAGVLPALTREGWIAIIAKPGSAPIAKLADALSAAARDDSDDRLAEARRYRFDAMLRASAFGLSETIRALLPEAPRLVLVIDQFEELFRFGDEARGSEKAAMQEEGQAFVELLLTASGDTQSRLHVVTTMRSDFFGSCADFAGLSEAVSASQYLVPTPARDALEESIREPVEESGAQIDDALVQRLLLDVEEQPDPLPTLQHTLRRLWELSEGEPKHLRETDYAGVGGMAGSIDQKAEAVVAGLVKQNARDLATLERVMKAITALDDQGRATRRPQKRSELIALLAEGWTSDAAAASLDRVLKALAREDTSFLQLGEGSDPDVDIGHEALIRSWRRLCGEQPDFRTGWLVEERESGRQWRELIGRVNRGQKQFLTDWFRTRKWMRDNAIGKVWSARYGGRWGDVGRLRNKSVATYGGLAGVVVAVLLVGGGWAWHHSREQAKEAVGFARKGALAAAGYAESLLEKGDARRAALVVLDVVPASRSENDVRYLPEVGSALARALGSPIETVRLRGHEKGVVSVAFSPDGRRIVSGSKDGTLRLWDAGSGAPIGEPLRGHEAVVWSVAFSPDGRRIVSSGDETLRLWDVESGTPIGEPLRGHEAVSVAFSPDGRRIVSGSKDGTLRLWDAGSGAPIGEPLRGHSYDVTSVAFSPDARRIVSGSKDGTLRLWDAGSGAPIGEPLRGHEAVVTSVAFSPDGRRIVSGSEDNTVRLWDAESGAPIGKPLRDLENAVWSVAFSPDGRRIVSGSEDHMVRLWDAGSGAPIGVPLRGHEDAVFSVAFSPDGRRIVSASRDNTVRLWDAGIGPIGAPLRDHEDGHKDCVMSVAFSPDGRRIVSGFGDQTLRLWDAGSGAPIGEPLRGHDDSVLSVAFSADGRRIVSGSRDKTLRLWDAVTGAPIGAPPRGHEGAVASVAFSPDGRRIVSGSNDNTVRLWDAATGAPIGEPLRGHENTVVSVAFSPDGRRIVSGSMDKTLRLWDAATGALIGAPLRGHEHAVWSVAFSPDGRRIVSGSDDNTVRLWDAATGAPIGEPLRGHENTVVSVAFSPDGRRIVSGSMDETLRLWDAATGALIGAPLRGHEHTVWSVAFSPDGRRIVSGSCDDTLRQWYVGPSALDELAGKAETLCPLSPAERRDLHLIDPTAKTNDQPLTDSQRRACGEAAVAK